MKDQMIDLIKSSAIVQGLIALVCVITVCYLYASGQPVPDSLLTIIGVVLGYYFGSKAQQGIQKGIDAYATRYERQPDPRTDNAN